MRSKSINLVVLLALCTLCSGGACSGTRTRNPAPANVELTVALGANPDPSLTRLDLCIRELQFVPAAGGDASSVTVSGGVKSASSNAVTLAQASIPARGYQEVRALLAPDCGPTTSLEWTNSSGTHGASDVITLKFATPFEASAQARTVTLEIQTFAAALSPISDGSLAKSALEAASGSISVVYENGVNLEVPVELTDLGLSSATSTRTFERTRTTLNTSEYDGYVTYFFEIVAVNTDTASRSISLVSSSGTQVSSITVPGGTSAPTRFRVSFILTVGADDYRVRLEGTPVADQLKAYTARALIQQVAATRTRIYVPLLSLYSDDSSNLDTTAPVLNNSSGTTYGVYNEHLVPLWQRNDSRFSQIASGQPFTFEAVIGTRLASSTAFISLFNHTTGQQVVESELSTSSNAPTLVSADFSGSASHFTDLNDFGISLKNVGGNGADAWVYRAGLWIRLNNLAHAEVYYRANKSQWLSMSGSYLMDFSAVLLNKSLFSAPVTLFHEMTGFIDASSTACSLLMVDRGVGDSGTTGSAVAGSLLSFTSTTRGRSRSAALSLPSGHQFISEAQPSLGPGNCLLVQPLLVVDF
jgi:hypothetical protein